MSTEIEFRTGDIFCVPADKMVVIAHIVNNVGVMGAGFALQVARKWPAVLTHYRANFLWANLGDIQFRDVDGNITICNMFAQDGLPSVTNRHPLHMEALHRCLFELAETLHDTSGYEVWMPRIGTGHGGGDWKLIEPLIRDTLIEAGIPVVVFDPEIRTHRVRRSRRSTP